MKNLKKALCMFLALVMALGMMNLNAFAAEPEYATVDELNAAFATVGEVLESGDIQGGIDALDAYTAIYNRLSPEDQEANAEALAAANAYRETLVASKEAGENGDGDEDDQDLDSGMNVEPGIQTLADWWTGGGTTLPATATRNVQIWVRNPNWTSGSGKWLSKSSTTITINLNDSASYTMPSVSSFYSVPNGYTFSHYLVSCGGTGGAGPAGAQTALQPGQKWYNISGTAHIEIRLTHTHQWSGWKHDSTQHWKECTICGEKGSQASHSHSSTVHQADCYNGGYTSYSNCICGYSKANDNYTSRLSPDYTGQSWYDWNGQQRMDCKNCNGGASGHYKTQAAQNVTYTVNHYYRLNGTQEASNQTTGSAAAGTVIYGANVAQTSYNSKDYSYNSSLSTNSITLSANGTNVLNLYYDRTGDTVTLTYHGNGNTGGTVPASQTVNKGESVTIAGKGTLVRTDYEFLGWSTDPHATTAEWNPPDTMRLNGNADLYAVWKKTDKQTVNLTVVKQFTGISSEQFCELYPSFALVYNIYQGSLTGNPTTTSALTEYDAKNIDEDTKTITWEFSYEKPADTVTYLRLAELGYKVDGYTCTTTVSPTGETFATVNGTYQADMEIPAGCTGRTYTVTNTYTKTAGYTVVWMDTDGNTLKAPEARTGTVGKTVSATTGDKSIEHYTYKADQSTASATLAASGTVLTLVFEKQLWVKWVDENGKTVLDGPTYYDKGDTEPSYSKTPPTKAEDEKNTYKFDKWVLLSTDDDGNKTYKATYTATPKNPGAVTRTIPVTIHKRFVPNRYGVDKAPTAQDVPTNFYFKYSYTDLDGPHTGELRLGDAKLESETEKGGVTYGWPALDVKVEVGSAPVEINLTEYNYFIRNDDGDFQWKGSYYTGSGFGKTNTGKVKVSTTCYAEQDWMSNYYGPVSTTPIDPATPADLSVTKTVDNAAPKAGETVVYTISVYNQGGETAKNVTVTDTLADELEFVSAKLNGNDITPTGGVYQIGDLPSEISATLEITAKVKEGTADNTKISNTATADYTGKPDGTDPKGEVDVTVKPGTPVTPNPDKNGLKLAKVVNGKASDTPALGAEVTYTVTVTNNTNVALKDLLIRDKMPAGMTLVEGSGSVTVDGQAGTVAVTKSGDYNDWKVSGVIADKAVVVLTYKATAPANAEQETALKNTAKAFANQNTAAVAKLQARYDIVSDDSSAVVIVAPAGYGFESNEDSATITVKPDDPGPGPGTKPNWSKLTVTKTANPTTAKAGEDIVYTITVTNNTGKNLKDIKVSENLPTQVTLKGEAPEGYNKDTGVWTIASLENGKSAELKLTVTVNEGVVNTTISNTVTVTEAKTDETTPETLPDGNKPTDTVDVTVPDNTPTPPPVIVDPTPTTYTVRYTDGVDGEEVFADQVNSGLRYGAATPAFNGTPSREGYVFLGWSPAVAETVTGNVTYVAQWEKIEEPAEHTVTVRPVDEDGNPIGEDVVVTVPEGEDYTVPVPEIEGYTPELTVVTGTMGDEDIVVIVTYTQDPTEPTDPDDPGEVDIDDPDTPLVDNPDTDKDPDANVPPEEVDIGDEDTPLIDVPQTGDLSMGWYAALMLSICGLVLLNLKRRKILEG